MLSTTASGQLVRGTSSRLSYQPAGSTATTGLLLQPMAHKSAHASAQRLSTSAATRSIWLHGCFNTHIQSLIEPLRRHATVVTAHRVAQPATERQLQYARAPAETWACALGTHAPQSMVLLAQQPVLTASLLASPAFVHDSSTAGSASKGHTCSVLQVCRWPHVWVNQLLVVSTCRTSLL